MRNGQKIHSFLPVENPGRKLVGILARNVLTNCAYKTVDFTRPLGCQEPVGMENGAISDWQISASSQYSANHQAIQGRLHFPSDGEKAGGWSAAINDVNQWLQVDLVTIFGKVILVATQGSSDMDQWVTVYSLQYGNDGVNFQNYTEFGQDINKVK